MLAPVQLIFASNWARLDGKCPNNPDRTASHETRCGRQIRLERGRWGDFPAMWLDWGSPQAPIALFGDAPRDPSGLPIALAAAVESSPDAAHWLMLLSHMSSPFEAQELKQRLEILPNSAIVTWRSVNQELRAVGFSGELYSELIRLDSAQALERLLRRYPCLQMGESLPSFFYQEHSPTVNR